MNDISYSFVPINTPFYNEAVQLRYKVFFEPNGTPINCIFDEIENESLHLVAVSQNTVIGYIRLTIAGQTGQISQFVVDPEFQGKNNIALTLFNMVNEQSRLMNVNKLWGEIRLHVVKAAKVYGFTVFDEIIYSKKTGIPHRRIEKIII